MARRRGVWPALTEEGLKQRLARCGSARSRPTSWSTARPPGRRRRTGREHEIHDDSDGTYGAPQVHHELLAPDVACGRRRAPCWTSALTASASLRAQRTMTTKSPRSGRVSWSASRRDGHGSPMSTTCADSDATDSSNGSRTPSATSSPPSAGGHGPLHQDLWAVVAPGLVQLDPHLPPDLAARSPPATAWRRVDHAIDDYLGCQIVAA